MRKSSMRGALARMLAMWIAPCRSGRQEHEDQRDHGEKWDDCYTQPLLLFVYNHSLSSICCLARHSEFAL
jgi:hypothetical protein